MNLIQKYYEEFGLQATYEKELEKFYNRIDNILPKYLDSRVFSAICIELGLRRCDFKACKDSLSHYYGYYFSSSLLPELTKNYSKLDAYRLLIAIFVNKGFIKSEHITEIINLSQIDLGFRFNEQEKFFYKNGDETLDKACIDDTLENLSSDKALSELYKKSLEKYFKKDTNCIHDAYSVLEKLFQKISEQPEAGIQATKNTVFSKFKISQNWKSITNLTDQFIDLASNHVRHPGEKDSRKKYPYNFNEHPEEIEAAMYLAGILIRLYTSLDQSSDRFSDISKTI
jgi:hypothetical protein